jgi:hypothetical protein
MKARQLKDRREEGGNKVGIRERERWGSNICFQRWSQISADTSLKNDRGVETFLTQWSISH